MQKDQKIIKPFNTSKLIITLFIVCLIIIETQNAECQQCVEISFYSCEICYDNCNEKQIFKKCDHTYCADSYTDSEGSSRCRRYQTESLKQQKCFSTCCGGQVTSTKFSIADLEKCQAHSETMTSIAIGVGVSIFGCCCVCITFCICRAFCCQSSCSICDCLQDFCSGCCQCFCFLITCGCIRSWFMERNQNNYPSESGQMQSRESVKLEMQNYKWQEQEIMNERVSDETRTCPICLCQRLNSTTQCGHAFHIQCLWQWNKRNKHCPVCMNTQIQPLKYYCRGCMKKYVRINSQKCLDIAGFITQVNGPNCPRCQ